MTNRSDRTNIEFCRTIKADDLRELLNNMSRDTLNRMIKEKEIPTPFKLRGTHHWRESTIHEWMEAKEAEAAEKAAA